MRARASTVSITSLVDRLPREKLLHGARVSPARRLARALAANAWAFCTFEIEHATFTERQRQLWAEVDALGDDVHQAVLTELRNDTRAA